MKAIRILIIFICFLVWIIPLGAFIKPAQEKKVCNGRRAICLCTHLVMKQKDRALAKQLIKNGQGIPLKNLVGSGIPPDFELAECAHFTQKQKQYLSIPYLFNYRYIELHSIDHVPKASLTV